MTQVIRHVINGEEVDSQTGRTFGDVDPFTGHEHVRVALGDQAEADAAIAAARTAFDSGPWPKMGRAERGRLLHRFAELIEGNAQELGMADTLDMGKPISDSVGKDARRTALNFRFFADHAAMSANDVYPMDSGHHAYSAFGPAGVVVAIAPWNFPMMLESWKVAPALAWGNTVVLKPAEDTPHSATIMGKLALEAGIPPGVFNVVHGFGPNSVGEFLTRSTAVDRITFTGESGTGRAISQAACANLIPVSLELGGKGANIVFQDADIDNALNWSISAIFSNAGQVCLAGSRLYVQRQIFDEFLARFVAAANALKLGDPKSPETDVGPLASQEHFKKVSSFIDSIEVDGATLVTGGIAEGLFVRPTVVIDAPRSARICREEIFGPVVVVQPFDTEDEAIALANDTRYGLNAMVFTENLSRAHRVAESLRAGTVWVNCFFIRDLRAPFGGVGDSGVGREGGNFSREFFTEPKAVVIQITR